MPNLWAHGSFGFPMCINRLQERVQRTLKQNETEILVKNYTTLPEPNSNPHIVKPPL